MEKKVNVVVRVRPQMLEDNVWVKAQDGSTLQTANHRNIKETLQYEFSHVFGPESTQQEVYEKCVAPLLSHTLKGQNASVLAYGPTGTGKTHTILGSDTEPGIIPQTVDALFKLLHKQQQQPHIKTNVTFSYIEIYNEKVQDLLCNGTTDLPLRMGADRMIQVAGVTEKHISNTQHFNKLFTAAAKNRTVAATQLNARSSRSHCLLTVKVERKRTHPPYTTKCGKLHLIDLAGSEDNRRTGNKGVRLKESGAINTSLLALGQVVNALNKGQHCIPYRDSKLTRLLQDSLGGSAHACMILFQHCIPYRDSKLTLLLQDSLGGSAHACMILFQHCIPYRDSKLTRLLQDSLGGSAHACMIVNLAPEERHCYDTYNTLNFACRTKKIINTIRTHQTQPVKPAVSGFVSEQHITTKRPAPEDSTTPPAKKSKVSNNIQPFLSPLLRNQQKFKEDLESEMMSRLQRLEEKLIVQMQESHEQFHSSATITPPAHNNDPQIVNKLDGILSRLKQQQKDNEQENEPPLKRRSSGRLSSGKPRNKHTERVFSDGSSRSTACVVEVSSSPLFKSLPNVIKRKRGIGLSSTAAAAAAAASSSLCSASPVEDKAATVQRSHNVRTMELLNNGSLKELQHLQTVGTKRAQLIHDYRAIHGNFNKFDDLLQVPGITEKYLKNFLRSNLVELRV